MSRIYGYRVRVKRFEVEDIPNAGCDNGNYPSYTITLYDGRKLTGRTCRCRNGCSGTDRTADIKENRVFGCFAQLMDCLDNKN